MGPDEFGPVIDLGIGVKTPRFPAQRGQAVCHRAPCCPGNSAVHAGALTGFAPWAQLNFIEGQVWLESICAARPHRKANCCRRCILWGSSSSGRLDLLLSAQVVKSSYFRLRPRLRRAYIEMP
jgi:hypothetical protein